MASGVASPCDSSSSGTEVSLLSTPFPNKVSSTRFSILQLKIQVKTRVLKRKESRVQQFLPFLNKDDSNNPCQGSSPLANPQGYLSWCNFKIHWGLEILMSLKISRSKVGSKHPLFFFKQNHRNSQHSQRWEECSSYVFAYEATMNIISLCKSSVFCSILWVWKASDSLFLPS